MTDYQLQQPLKIQAGGSSINLSQVNTLHPALRHLPSPENGYHYEKNAIVNLLLFACIADEFYIVCNTRVDDAIYVVSKDNGQYLQFKQDLTRNLYYIDIGDKNIQHTRFFSPIDCKQAECVRNLQEMCGSPSDEDFIRAITSSCKIILEFF